MKIFVVTAEDLLISKLIWIQELKSNFQIEDVTSLVQLENLDLNYVHFWINQLNLNTSKTI